jgi:predicted transposase YbfD/YdcC
MENTFKITDYFANIETTKEHNGYLYNVGDALVIVILGSLCGLRNPRQVSDWAANSRVQEILSMHFGITSIPCYFWLLRLLSLIKPDSLNECFINWVKSLLAEGVEDLTISFDGKTIRSTGKMEKYTKPMHIVSAQIAEMGLTFGQKTVYEKSNEIPAVRELLELLELTGCIVVADALNCQKETAKAIISKGADYLLSVKDNQKSLKEDIEGRIHDESLQKAMDITETWEKNRGREEYRKAFVIYDIRTLPGKNNWEGIVCIGAINRQFTTKKGKTDEWHYYISSRKLTAAELLKHARAEWSVESMHWLLDVHFTEDFCRVVSKNVQQNLNISRKISLNCIKRYKEKTGDKRPISRIMLDCLLEPVKLLHILGVVEN